MSKDAISAMGLLTIQERQFCEGFMAHGDIARAVRENGVQVPLDRSAESFGKDLLNKPVIRDYLAVLGHGDTGELGALIDRLHAVRREAWRRGDYKETKNIDMEIARLSGWLIERTESKISSTSMTLVAEMSNADLMKRLQGVDKKKLLTHNVKLLADGKLDIIDGEIVDEQR